MYKLIYVFAFSALPASCRFGSVKKNDLTDAKHEEILQSMVDTDQAFSEACAQKGMRKAFLEYMADDAVLLRPGNLPLVEDDVVRYLSAHEDTSFVMKWEPKGGDLSASNDLGYTYGVYEVKTKDTVLTGTYLSIWRRQEDGTWKFVLDTGNPGTSTDSTTNNQ